MKLDLSTRYVLSEDVTLTPVTELSSALREKFQHDSTDFAITKRNSRQRSKIVDMKVSLLIETFKTPKTLADGLSDFGRAIGAAPDALVDSVGDILLKLIQAKILTTENSEESRRTTVTLCPGDRLGAFVVERAVQVLDDSEVYFGLYGSTAGALKVARSAKANETIEREAQILAQVPPGVAPRVLKQGRLNDKSWLVVEWLEGSTPTKIARLLRADGTFEATERLLRLCIGIIELYATLHSHGFVHGDIHPKNIVVGADEQIRLIDFGLAFHTSDTSPGRAGVETYYEPEMALELLNGRKAPRCTALGEQYAAAVLLYELLTGSAYLYFNVEKTKMLRQIIENLPVPFAMRGLFGHSHIQEILSRALEKNPSARFPSMRVFASALRSSCETTRVRAASPAGSWTDDPHVQQFLSGACDWNEGLISDVFRNAPCCSVNHGAAGVAYALYRISVQLQDSKLMSFADIWIQRALEAIGHDKAFYNASMDLLPHTVGSASLYHGAPGIHCVHALISGAAGDFVSQREAIANFLASAEAQTDNCDLTIGKSGLLLGASLILDATRGNRFADPSDLVRFGRQLFDEIWRDANHLPEMLGIAHGAAGMTYAALRWCQSNALSIPPPVQSFLEQLAAAAEATSDGVRWRRLRDGNDYVPSWCNGAAGFVFLWTEAFRATGSDLYLDLAKGAAQVAFTHKEQRPSLCCGLAGRAFALLNLFRHTGDGKWVDAAAQMLKGAREAIGYSLYNGAPGAVLLAVDLAHPEGACMPLFESDQRI